MHNILQTVDRDAEKEATDELLTQQFYVTSQSEAKLWVIPRRKKKTKRDMFVILCWNVQHGTEFNFKYLHANPVNCQEPNLWFSSRQNIHS